ncbi:MAG TPA: S-layer homology domain-containing protein [Chloroflexia bacterium]
MHNALCRYKWQGPVFALLTALLVLVLSTVVTLAGGARIARGAVLTEAPYVGNNPGLEAPEKTSGGASSGACVASFEIVDSPSPGALNYIYGMEAISSNDVWAVGFTSEEALFEHWDGNTWSVVPPGSSPTSTSHVMAGVSALSSDDIWAVGHYYAGPEKIYATLIEHWDGSQWTIVPSPDPGASRNRLFDVLALSSTDVWAVGVYGPSDASTSFILHWDGVSWSQVANPNPASSSSYLGALSATAPDDIWAVGFRTNLSTHINHTLIEHWDGTSWSIVPSPNPGGVTDPLANNILSDIKALAPDNAWAVGLFNTGEAGDQTLIAHWDGTTWSAVPGVNPGTYSNRLSGIDALSADDVWASGTFAHSEPGRLRRPLVLHFDGGSWSQVEALQRGEAGSSISAVTVAGPDDVWIGGVFPNGGEQHTLTEHYSNDCAVTCTLNFADVPSTGAGSTFYDSVRCLACKNIISGYPCGGPGEACNGNDDPYYRPGANVTRGQLSKIIANSAGLDDPIAEGQQQFADVPPGSPFYEFVERLAQTGAIAGYPCGVPGVTEPCDSEGRPYFRPNNPATRGQISKIVSIAAGFEEDVPTGQETFTDVDQDSPFWVYIERLAGRGIISGYGEASRCPETGAPCFRYNENTTRGQMAKIAANAFFPNCSTPARP